MEDQLLIRFLTRQCSAQENEEINEWIKNNKANADWLFEVERLWSLKDELRFSEENELQEAFNTFVARQNPAQYIPQHESLKVNNIRSLFSGWVKYAAAILIIGLFSIQAYNFFGEAPVTAYTIEVPKGQMKAVTLSDGSKAWLNSDSRLTYPSQFPEEERRVTLEGEGYFEIAKDAKKPFIIHSAELDVKVLGTKFNMKVYKGEGSSVVLKEGKVEVSADSGYQKIILRPNEKASFSTTAGLQLVKNADTTSSESWRTGEMAFTGEPLINITRALERKFDTKILIKDAKLENELFTCRVVDDASLKEILDLLRKTRKLDYKMEKEKVIILKN
jgi:transmembrane sensor